MSMQFSESHSAYLAAITMSSEPKSYSEAVKLKIWRDSMKEEIVAQEEAGTWDIASLPPGKTAIPCMWIYRDKFNPDGTIHRHKSRLLACGNSQKEGDDFKETFAPVVKMNTVRYLLRLATAKEWEVHQMDVHNAFLHGDLQEEVYMRLPPGFTHSDPTKVCRLNKSIYGLRQAPRCWFAKLSSTLLDFGFVQSYYDYSLFSYTKGVDEVRVLVYVDDLIIATNSMALMSQFKTYLSQCFKMKDLGKLRYFLGIEVARSAEGMVLSQRKYTLDLIADVGLTNARPVATPVEQNHHLAADKSTLLSDPKRYRRLVGRLVYLANTRPEFCYAIHLFIAVYEGSSRRSLACCYSCCEVLERVFRSRHSSLFLS